MGTAAIAFHNVGKMFKLYAKPFDRMLDLLGLSRWTFWHKPAYREFWALRGLNLEVARGDRLGIVGHNGAGKSTMLKLVLGSLRPTEGHLRVSGRVQALMELGTGFHPEFTGRQNVRAALALQGFARGVIREKEEEIIDFSELEEFIDRPLKTYSAGMYARLAFATATSFSPEVLIIDEILGAGDAYFVGKCIERMQALTEKTGATVLFVSHDVASVQRLSTRAVWMKEGGVFADGKPIEVVRDYLAYMQRESDLRLRARDMKLRKSQARALLTSDDVYKRYLFRLRMDGRFGDEVVVTRLALSLDGKEVASIVVGRPMDNDLGSACHVIDDAKGPGWTNSRRHPAGFARAVCATGDRIVYAPFVLAAPSYLTAGRAEMHLDIEHGPVAAGAVAVEFFEEGGYTAAGCLNPAGGLTRLAVPVAAQQPREGAGRVVHVGEEDTAAVEVRGDVTCKIVGLDFILPDGSDVKVVPRGSQVEVRLRYEATRPVRDPVFAITFFRADGCQVDHQNSKLLGAETGSINGAGHVSFHFDPLRIGSGDYFVSAAILQHLEVDNWHELPPCYDRHDRRYSLKVAPVPGARDFGLVVQESRFQLGDAGERRMAG